MYSLQHELNESKSFMNCHLNYLVIKAYFVNYRKCSIPCTYHLRVCLESDRELLNKGLIKCLVSGYRTGTAHSKKDRRLKRYLKQFQFKCCCRKCIFKNMDSIKGDMECFMIGLSRRDYYRLFSLKSHR